VFKRPVSIDGLAIRQKQALGFLLTVVIGSILVAPAFAHCTKRIKASTPTAQFNDEDGMAIDKSTHLKCD
jgi:hypothetical protein